MSRVRTQEDVPGPVGDLVFRDILLDSVNVSWSPPQQPNGRIQWYIVNYRTYKMSDEFRKEIQQKTALTYLLATNLEEGVAYYFTVRAENTAGLGGETVGNVTIGHNQGAPDAPDRPLVVPEQSTFVLRWEDGGPGISPIKGHIIQAKRTRPAPPVLVSLSAVCRFNAHFRTRRLSRMRCQYDALDANSLPRSCCRIPGLGTTSANGLRFRVCSASIRSIALVTASWSPRATTCFGCLLATIWAWAFLVHSRKSFTCQVAS